jgi:hypothetical protein
MMVTGLSGQAAIAAPPNVNNAAPVMPANANLMVLTNFMLVSFKRIWLVVLPIGKDGLWI